MDDYEPYDSMYDIDGNGKLDAYEYFVMVDDDDYYYDQQHKPSGSRYTNNRSSAEGFGVGKSIFIGLLLSAVFSAVLGLEDVGEFGLVMWGVFSFLMYFGTNSNK